MKKDILVVVFIIFSIVFVYSWVQWSIQKDQQLFRKELIWYSRFKVVEDLASQKLSEDLIYEILLSEPASDWTEDEIRYHLDLIRYRSPSF